MIKYTQYIFIGMFLIFAFNQCDNVNSEAPDEEPVTVELMTPINNASEQALEVELKWKKIKGAKEYIAEVATDSEFSDVVADSTIEGTSFVTPELSPNETYHWRVLPLDRGPNAEWSDVWSFTTGDSETTVVTTSLLSPEDGAVVDNPDISFSWEDVQEADQYNFQVSNDTSFSELVVDSLISAASVNLQELPSGNAYGWRVTPVLNSGTGGASSARTFTVEEGSTQEEISVSLSAPADASSDVSINPLFEWTGSGDITEYTLVVSAQSDLSDPAINTTVQDQSYDASGLNYSTEYFWQVTAQASTGNTSSSSTFSFNTEDETVEPPVNNTDFVQVENGNFVLDGQPFRYAGTNAYYLPNYEKINPGVVDRAMELFDNTGVNVVRMWGFYDGYDCGYSQNDASENVIQTAPGEYSEEALKDLDQVIAQGKERGIRFIIPFVNYWDELGGICQYNTWAGASDPSTNMDFFMNNEQTQKWYKDYINMLLNRVNTVTGVAYKNEPAILGWQIMNEGRNRGQDAAILRDWYQDIAQYIKSIDPNHLLSTGEEGFDEGTPSEYTSEDYSNTYTLRANEGTSYIMNTEIPEIDFGNAHWYPTEYGFGSTVDESFLTGQRAWLNDHQKIAENVGKPFIIGEYGYPGWGDERVDQMYNAFYAHAESIALDGNLLWQLVADGTKCWEFGGNICYPDGRTDTDLYNKFKQHVANMKALD